MAVSPAELGGEGEANGLFHPSSSVFQAVNCLFSVRGIFFPRGKTSVVVVPAPAPEPEEGKLGKGATTT